MASGIQNKKITVSMEQNKVTKGTIRFAEVGQGDNAKIGSIYIPKESIPSGKTKIKLTVEFVG